MMKTNRVIQKIKKTIINNNLIAKGDKVLVALSGGADSVLLLTALSLISSELEFELAACHVEHGIRGDESVSDMRFSESISTSAGIRFFCKRFDVPSVAADERLSLEAAGRKIRYEYFDSIIKEHGFTKLATAHHRDDKTETVVMNIIRGCSLRGYVGIEYKNNNIIRPLLDLTKKEIVDFLELFNIEYCIDKTNNETEYTRNKIRLDLLPELRKYNPSFDENLLRQSMIFADEDEYMRNAAEAGLAECSLSDGMDIQLLLKNHKAIQRRILYMYIARYKNSAKDITGKDIESCISLCKNSVTGKSIKLTNGITARVDYGVFSVSDYERTENFEYQLSFSCPLVIEEIGLRITLLSDGGNLDIKPGSVVSVRNRRDGDRFYPVGMTGSKKVKDYFTDKKIKKDMRDRIPILTVDGEIASVVGMRDDRRFRTGEGTCRILTETV